MNAASPLGPLAIAHSNPQGTWVEVFGLHELNVTDVRDVIADAERLLKVKLEAVRLVGGPDIWSTSNDALDISTASDLDLGRFALLGSDVSPTHNTLVQIMLGSEVNPQVQVDRVRLVTAGMRDPISVEEADESADVAAFGERVCAILNGSRRVPRWVWARWLRWAALLVPAMVWVGFAVAALPNLWAALVGLFATVSFMAVTGRWLADWQRRRHLAPFIGRVRIVAKPREQMRLERANSRRDLKVGATSAIVTLLAAAITVLLTRGF